MKKKVIAFLRDMIFYILGSAIYSFAIANVLSAAQISPGGITGIATSLNFLFGLPVGIMTFCSMFRFLPWGFTVLEWALLPKLFWQRQPRTCIYPKELNRQQRNSLPCA